MNISDDPTRMEQPDEPEGGSLRPGQTFGQYKVIGLLGRGGMGEVYRVRHEVLEREYALKLIHPKVLESRDALQRFQDEARVMAKLDHPNIVKVDDFGTTEGRHWLRMELIALIAGGDENGEGRMANSAPLRSSSFPLRQDSGGQVEGSPSAGADSERESTDQASFFEASLGEYVRAHDGRLPESQVREILRQILEGLGYAHGKGLVHRDIKPANILLAARASDDEGRMADSEDHASTRVPQVKIADFGLVRVAGEDWLRSQVEKSVAHSTSSGQAQSMSISEQATRVLDSDSGQAGTSTRALLGTYAYMSPEQKRGEDVDARSDLYAVGLMAYQMLTGLESLGMERPSEIIEGLNPEWDSWVLKSTKSKRGERFGSAEEMLAALPSGSAAVPQRGTMARSPSAEADSEDGEGGKKKRRRDVFRMASLLFIVCLLSLGTWQLWFPWWESYIERRAVTEEVRGPVRGQDYTIDLGGGVQMEFVWIADLNAWVGKYEVTNGEFRRFWSGHDSGNNFNGSRQPVVQVNYEDAVAFATWLSGREGLEGSGVRARLLNGNEWTAIARCGTNREFPWGDRMPPTRGNYSNLISWYSSGAGRTVNVEQSGRNEWGLYGVGGNVWEWTSEQSGSSRVLRGASWNDFGSFFLRVEGRRALHPSYRVNDFGFRVVLSGGG